MFLMESERERGKTSEPGARQCVSDIGGRVRDDVFATLSLYPPRPTNLRTSHPIVRSTRRVLWRLFHFRSGSSETISTEEDTTPREVTARPERLLELQNDEGKTPGMSSVTRLVSPRRGDTLEGEMGPYIPSSPVEDLSGQEVADGPQHENTSHRETEVGESDRLERGDRETTTSPSLEIDRRPRSFLATWTYVPHGQQRF